MTGTASRMISVARNEIGVREGRDKNGNWNNKVKYNDWYVDEQKFSEGFRRSAWCAIFVSWVARKAGVPTTVIPNHAWTPSGWSWFKNRGLNVSQPVSGDIVYFYYPSKKRVAHVGIVERRDGNYIYTIEGNTNNSGSSQGNGVYRLKRRINSNMRFARPRYNNAQQSPNPPQKGPAGRAPKILSSVSVTNLKKARFEDPPKKGNPLGSYSDEVYTMEVALAKTQWLKWGYVDGHFGTVTVGDGSLGYGGTRGFQRKHSEAKKPDGWLGPKELTKLFRLARMNVKVNP